MPRLAPSRDCCCWWSWDSLAAASRGFSATRTGGSIGSRRKESLTVRSASLRTVLLGLISLALAACSSATPTGGSPSGGAPAPAATSAAPAATSAAPAAAAGSASDVGVTKDAILIGATVPLSGPAAAYGTIAKASDAYFHFINDQGGINGRQISYKYLDGAYNPAQTVPLTKQRVEQDQVFLTFGGLGTQAQTSVRDYLNSKKVPQGI